MAQKRDVPQWVSFLRDQFLNHRTRHEDGGNDEISLTGLSGTRIDLAEASEPATPGADTVRLFAEDYKGFSLLSFKDDTGMVRKIVRDSVFVGYNNTGSAIAKARIVYAAASFGDVPSVALAKADSAATMPAIGVTLELINNGAYGRVMQVGLLEDVNTSALSAGDLLYVSAATAGIPVSTAPVYPNLVQEIGTVLVDSATVGAIQIVARAVTALLHATAHQNGEADEISIAGLSGVPEIHGIGSPTQLTGNTNDWATGTFGTVRADTDGAYDVTGIVAQATGFRMTVVNIAASTLTFKHQDANSAAANRFLCDTGADLAVATNQAVDLIYDGSTARWRAWLK